MANPVSLEHRTAIVWKIENINFKNDYYSEYFSLLGARWRFRYVHVNGPEIRLEKVDRNEKHSPFISKSYFETSEGSRKLIKTVEVERDCVCKSIWKLIGEGLVAGHAVLPSGVVAFVCLYTPLDICSKATEHKSVQTLRHMYPLPCFESLSSDFKDLMVSGAKPDAMLKCGDRTIPVHRLVLSARSEVFSAMFSNDMRESRTGSVDIVDLDQHVLEELLQYLYSGKVDNLTVDTAQSLYKAGDKYAVHALKDRCMAFLLESLNDQNVICLLVFADKYSDKVMKDRIIEYFVENDSILENDAWFQFSNNQPMLAVEVYRLFCNKRKNKIK